MLTLLDKQKADMDESELWTFVRLRQAFLYALAQKIDSIAISIDKNPRGITPEVVKTFIKQVFIKHELQGINFRAWDADDLDSLKLSHFPSELKNEVETRRLSIVETARFWFLIAPIRNFSTNRYSIVRFLNDDTEYGLYTTYGCYVPRHHLNEDVINTILKLLGTIYTLEISAGAHLLNFIHNSRKAFRFELQPLLRQPLNFNHGVEIGVAKRLETYQEKLDSLILASMPHVIKAVAHSQDDRAIFGHYVESLLNDIWQDIGFFTMLPAIEYADATEIFLAKIMCYRLFLRKSQHHYWDNVSRWHDAVEQALSPTAKILEAYENIYAEQQNIAQMKSQLETYEASIAGGKFLAKMGFGKPKFTAEDIEEYTKDVSTDFFMDIIRLAKAQKEFMVYYEFESMLPDTDIRLYRHYSTPTGKTGLEKLPILIRLPENRQKFDAFSFALIDDEFNNWGAVAK